MSPQNANGGMGQQTPPDSLEINRWFGVRAMIAPTSIQTEGWGQSRTMQKSEIAGFRTAAARGVTYYIFYSIDPNAKPLRIAVPYDKRKRAEAALAGYKNLDTADYHAALEAIRQNDAFGATPEERMATLANEKRQVWAATAVAIAIAAWAVVYPQPRDWALGANLVAFLVFAGLTVLKQGRWRMDAGKNDPRPSASFAVWIPALALTARAIFDEETFDWLPWLTWAGGIGAAIALIANTLFEELRKVRRLLLTGVLGALFGLGAVGVANARFDAASPQVFPAEITSQYVSRGRSTSYDVVLAPWGPSSGGTQSVSYDFYYAHHPGDTVCVMFHPGALHIRWYILQDCPAPTADDKPAESFEKPSADK